MHSLQYFDFWESRNCRGIKSQFHDFLWNYHGSGNSSPVPISQFLDSPLSSIQSSTRSHKQNLYEASCLGHQSSTMTSPFEHGTPIASSDDEDDRNSVIETASNKQEGLFFLLRNHSERDINLLENLDFDVKISEGKREKYIVTF